MQKVFLRALRLNYANKRLVSDTAAYGHAYFCFEPGVECSKALPSMHSTVP